MTSDSHAGRGPLDGIRVVDLSTVFAAPYMGGLLTDFGAEVIKVEAPGRLDQTRGTGFGPFLDNDPGDDGWNWAGSFHNLNRGKKSLVLDLKHERGREILRTLLAQADILLENFTPRVLRGWSMTYDDLVAANPKLVMLSNTGYGATGPWSEFKAQGTSLEATMGLTNYNGYRGAKPKKIGQSYPDFLAAWTGLIAIQAALFERVRTGRGRRIDLSMYELGPVMIPEAMIAAQAGEPAPGLVGDDVPGTLLSEVFRCNAEEDWLAVSIVDDAMLGAASSVVPGLPAAILDERHRSAAVAALELWAGSRHAREGAEALQAVGVAASPVATVRDLLEDSQYLHRGFFDFVTMRDDARPFVGRPYRWHGRRSVRVRRRGPLFGEHNDEVLRSLGLSDDAIADLRSAGVVTDQPQGVRPMKPTDLQAMVAAGLYRSIDPDYLAVMERAAKGRTPAAIESELIEHHSTEGE